MNYWLIGDVYLFRSMLPENKDSSMSDKLRILALS
jgi:hypothetical protein